MRTPDQSRRAFLETMGVGVAGLSASGQAVGEDKPQTTGAVSSPVVRWRKRENGQQTFFLDPLEGERLYPNEPLFR